MSDDGKVERAIAALEQLRGKIPGIEAQIEQLRSHRGGVIGTAPAAIAGDGGRAAAHRSLAAETVSHSVVVTGHVEGGIYLGPRPHDATEALAAYRRVLVASARHLPLRGIDVGAADPSRTQQRLELAAVYIDLETRPSRIDLPAQPGELKLVKTEQWSLLTPTVLHEVLMHRRLVLLGDPGSGKSTFLNHLLLCLAAHGLDPTQGWLQRLPRWPAEEADLVPIPVLLRDFARTLRERTNGSANPLLLWRFLERWLAEQRLEAAGDALHDALDRGRAILLLDGLDEVSNAEDRQRLRAIVDAIARRYPAARILVTCRTLSYQDPAWQLDGLPSAELAPFDEPRIEHFISAWYGELRRMGIVRSDEAGPLGLALREAVHRKDLWRLAPNPLLLTVMALIHTHKGRLPDARARLYEDTIDLLLWRWDELRTSGAGEELGLRKLLRDAACDDIDLHRTLWQLAYKAHAQGDAGKGEILADIGEHDLETALAQLHPRRSRDWALQVIEVMKLRAGLLLERSPGVYTFPHRTFQEYLAGAHLAARPNFATEVSQLDVTQWREVILLAVGRLVYVHLEIDRPLLLVLGLCGDDHAAGELELQRAAFAADVLLEIGIKRVLQAPEGAKAVNRLRRRLRSIIDDPAVRPDPRVLAGDRLGRIGDPRFDPAWFSLPGDPLHGFVEIPDGAYEVPSGILDHAVAQVEASMQVRVDPFSILLSGELLLLRHRMPDRFQADLRRACLRIDVSRLTRSEDPRHLVAWFLRELRSEPMDRQFYIARYPVTEDQFDAYLTHVGRTRSRGARRGKNYPVVDVSFQDALAYCAWLTARLTESKGPLSELLEIGWRLLPCSRDEWEKALFAGSCASLFPWGNEERTGASNQGVTTTPVGVFPEARTRDGVDDLIGNVWEYMRDQAGRMVSGGSAPSQLDALFQKRIGNRERTGFRLVLTRAPWTPPEPDAPEPPPRRTRGAFLQP